MTLLPTILRAGSSKVDSDINTMYDDDDKQHKEELDVATDIKGNSSINDRPSARIALQVESMRPSMTDTSATMP